MGTEGIDIRPVVQKIEAGADTTSITIEGSVKWSSTMCSSPDSDPLIGKVSRNIMRVNTLDDEADKR